jgi:putative inorganic carbon (HCO3(-)) transporter
MKKEKYLNVVNRIISFSILANLFLLPVFFDCFYLFKNIFILPKTIIFYTLLSLLFISTLIKLFLIEKIKFSQKFLFFCLIPIFLLLSLAVSSLFSFDISLAWKGLYNRQNGLFFYVNIFLWFILVSFNYYQDKKFINLRKILLTVAFSSFFVSIYAIFQYFGIDRFIWTESTNGGRVFSSLGQPNYLGLFINFVWPVVFYLLISEKKKYYKIFFGFLLCLNFLALIFSFSRSAWLGFLFGFVFLFLYYFLKVSKKKALIGLLFFVIISPFFLTQKYFVYRINNLFEYKSGSGADRIVIWQTAIEKIKKRPILGYGLEQQEILFRSSYNKDWALYEDYTTFADRTHNIVLDYLLIGGFVYLSLFFVFLFFLFKAVYYFFKKDKVGPEVFLGLSIFIYLISLLFSFETIVDLVYFWTFSAFIFINFIKAKGDGCYINNFLYKFKNIFKIIISIFLISIFLISTFSYAKFLIADYNFFLFEKSFYREEFDEGICFYEKALEKKSEKMYYEIFIKNIYFYNEKIKRDPSLDLLAQEAYYNLNDYYNDLIIKAKAASFLKNFKGSEVLLNRAIEEAPENYRAYYTLSEIYFENNKYKLADEYSSLTLNKLPKLTDGRLQESHKKSLGIFIGKIYEKKAFIASYDNDEKLSIEYLEKAFENNNNILLLKKIADKYYNLNMMDKAIEYNLLGENNSKDDPAWPTAVAWLYYLDNDFDKAEEKINRALFLDNDYENALELKKLLSN